MLDSGRPCRWLGYFLTDGSAYVLEDASHSISISHGTCLHLLPTDPLFCAQFNTAPSASPLSAVAETLIPSSPGIRRSARPHQLGSFAMCALVFSLSSLVPSSSTLEALDPNGASVYPVFCVSDLSSTTYQPHFDTLHLASSTTDATASCV